MVGSSGGMLPAVSLGFRGIVDGGVVPDAADEKAFEI